ncbi:hypothetical protein EON73_00825 [bacterium]|nr:MAG: hypothetical protein EON73_00825 [bacterium]
MLTFFKKYAKEFEIEFDYTKIGLIEGKCFDLISQKVCLTGELPNLYKYEGPIDFNNTKSNNKFLSISRQICLCLASPVLWLSATNVKLILSNKLELLLVDINILETAPSIIPQGYYILNLDLFVVLIKKVGPFKVEDLGIIQVTANCSSAKFHLNQVLFSVVSSVFVSAEGNFDYMQVKDLVL